MIGMNSDHIYGKMIVKMFNTTMSWFLENPSSKITFRLTRDQLIIDDQLNKKIQEFFDSFMIVVGGNIILNFIYLGPMLIVSVGTFFYLYFILKNFFKVTQRLTEFEAEKKV